MDVFTLDYTYVTPMEAEDRPHFSDTQFNKYKNHKKIFAPMGSGYYLIRARKEFTDIGKVLMLQTLVYKDGSNVITKSCEEIWY